VGNILKIGFPKGSLQDSTFDLYARAGYRVKCGSRSYIPSINDPEIEGVMFRAQEMSRYVEDGVVDMGLTGYDWICENGSDVIEVCELVYSKVSAKPAHWVLAVPNESTITKVEDLEGGIVATELLNVTRHYYEYTIEKFGVDRCMFESNFPVDKVSCSYMVCWNSFKRLTANYSADEKAKLYHDTAARVYKLDD